jgi:hypothetical protein
VECWPALAQFGVNRFFLYTSLDYSQKWIHYEFGLGQGSLGMNSGKRLILQKSLNLHSLMMLTIHIFSVFAL